MGKKTEVLDSKCPHCGGKIEYNPKSSKWKCLFCDTEMTLEELQEFNNASNTKSNESVSEEAVDDYDEYVSYTCKDCGAEIVADKETTATFCVYCGNTAILKNKLSGKFAPSHIIPFKKDKKDAEEAFVSLSKGRKYIPRAFTDKKNIEKIRGIYVPFWFHTFKISGELDYTGKVIKYWSVGDTDYTKTDIYDVIRDGEMVFKSVPTDGSSRFDDGLMNTIQPYDYSEMVPYNHAFLSGFLAERYDVLSNDTRKIVEPDVLNVAKSHLLDSGRYNSTSIKRNTLETVDYSIDYVLLPVYMVNVKYEGKMHTFAMNGQSGKFIGDIPIDKKKLFIHMVLVFVILFAIFIGISYLIFGGGK